MDLPTLRKLVSEFGLPATLQGLSQRVVSRAFHFRILKCVRICEPNPKFLKVDERYAHRFLDEAILRGLTADPKFDVSTRFLDEALAKGDQCYGFLDGERVAAFGWYSLKPTKISDDLTFHFGSAYAYMYKGFTDPDYRGQRLHALGMTWALKLYRERGLDGLVSYVESDNFDSLRSCYRMGYQDVGQIYYLRAGGRYLIHVDGGCLPYAVNVTSP
jgi:hypothetical protein